MTVFPPKYKDDISHRW